MKRLIKWRYIIISLALLFILPIRANAFSGTELSRETIAPGTVLRTVKWNTGRRNLVVDVIEVDLTNPGVDIRTIPGGGKFTQKATVSQMANRTNAVATVNGDFYNTLKQGAPFGPVVEDGKLQATPLLSVGLHAFGIDGNNTAHVEPMSFEGKVTAPDGGTYPIGGLNKTEYVINTTAVPSHKDAIHVYNDHWSSISRGAKGAGELLVDEEGVVEKISLNGPLSHGVPPGKQILQFQGKAKSFVSNHIKVGNKLNIHIKLIPDRNWKMVIGGHAMLVKDGKPVPYTLDVNSIGGRRARSAIGASQNGKKVYIASSEGKTKKNAGVTLNEWGPFMADLGAHKAMNLDGGGSTTMVARHLGEFETTQITRPERGGSERSIVNGVGVFNISPEGPLAEIVLSGAGGVVQGEVSTYSILKGWDENLHPKKVDHVNYSITDSLVGKDAWSGQRYRAPEAGRTEIVLTTMDGVVGKKVVNVFPLTDIKSFELITEDKSFTEGDQFNIAIEGTTKSDRKFTLDPAQLTWEFEDMIGAVDTSAWIPRQEDGSLLPPEAVVNIMDMTEHPVGYLKARLNGQEASLRFVSPHFKQVHLNIGKKPYAIDGAWFEMDTVPFIQNDRTLVPLRFLLEAYGADVSWDQPSRTAIVNYKGSEIKFPIGEAHAYVNGEQVELDCSAILQDDRTMIPIRFLSESLDMEVEYIHESRTVNIYENR